MRVERFGAVRRASLLLGATVVVIVASWFATAVENSRAAASAPGPAGDAAVNDEQIRRLIMQLADNDADVRQKTLGEMVQSRDGRLAGLLNSYVQGSLYLWNGRPVISEPAEADAKGKRASLLDPLTLEQLPQDGKPVVVSLRDLKEVELPRSQRKAVVDAAQSLALWSNDFEQRVLAIQRAGERAAVENLAALDDIAKTDPSARIRRTARESVDLIHLSGGIPHQGEAVDRLQAARDLGLLHSARGRSALTDALVQMDKEAKAGKSPDAAARNVYQQAIAQIDRYQYWVSVFECGKYGLSLASILILMALGLAITFGTMGVINMAHGELMMIGAFTTYSMELLFVRCLPAQYFNWYYVAALPASFLVAGFCGYLIELLVVRHLYGRPLETLLATFGVSWILIKSVQNLFGESIGVNAPTWLRGSIEVMPDMDVPYSRAFVVLLCAFCVTMFYLTMNYTKLGLRIRATTQNREMAAALGVNTRWVDGCTFALGAGLAGIAGYGMTVIGGVSPGMGQNYIVESFLVVVTGGVGELAGTLYAGLGLGLLDKILEPWFGAVWGEVLVLVAIVIFLQRRPAGLFPPKGRHADV